MSCSVSGRQIFLPLDRARPTVSHCFEASCWIKVNWLWPCVWQTGMRLVSIPTHSHHSQMSISDELGYQSSHLTPDKKREQAHFSKCRCIPLTPHLACTSLTHYTHTHKGRLEAVKKKGLAVSVRGVSLFKWKKEMRSSNTPDKLKKKKYLHILFYYSLTFNTNIECAASASSKQRGYEMKGKV